MTIGREKYKTRELCVALILYLTIGREKYKNYKNKKIYLNVMGENICLPQTHLIIIICVFIGLAVWYIHGEKKKHIDEPNYKYSDQILSNIAKSIAELPEKLKEQEQKKEQELIISPELEKRIALAQRDQDVIVNDFAPPERRVPAHAYPDRAVRKLINIPSRGAADSYQMLGIVLRNNTETAYNLFGRQTFPGSNQYEYYVQGNMDGNIVKIPIKIRGDREIEDGQGLQIPGTDPAKGGFKVQLYKLDSLRYNPHSF